MGSIALAHIAKRKIGVRLSLLLLDIGQLEYYENNSCKKVDFFIVSPKGLFVIESKKWKGVTYIYRKECEDLFDNTMFDTFGVASNKAIRVFNAKRNDDNQNQLVLSPYTNPIAQARGYSVDLLNLLKKQTADIEIVSIKNVVVFHSGNDYKVLVDNNLLENDFEIDVFTHVITDDYIQEFFSSQPNCGIDALRVNETLNSLLECHYLQCNFKIDIDNYTEAPFK